MKPSCPAPLPQYETNAGLRVKLYFSTAVTLTISSTNIALAAPFTGVLRIAVLRSPWRPIMAYDAATAAVVEALYDTYKGELTRDSCRATVARQ